MRAGALAGMLADSAPPETSVNVRGSRATSALLALFFLSGAGGLVYEVLWTRRLTLVFGSGLFATATILATFMGGLALGSWWLGRRVDRRDDPLAYFGRLEIGVGLYALAVPYVLAAILPLYRWVYGASDGADAVVNATRFVLCAAVFVLPTVLMGGTLPALSRFVARETRTLGASVGRLYAVNTLGAVAGSVVAGFVLIEVLGIRRTEMLTAAVNLGVGSTALAWGRRARLAPVETSVPDAGRDRAPVSARRLALTAYALSGLAALGYEVAWTRLLTFFLGNSTYAFAAMLATFLLGLALGAFAMARVVERLRDPWRWFALLQLGIAASVGVALAAYPDSPGIYLVLSKLFAGGSWLEWIVVRFAIAAALLLAPTLLMGAAFPLASRLYLAERRRVGADVGRLYAANTVGAIAGSVGVGFVLIPLLGVRTTVVALIGLNAAVAIATGRSAARHGRAIAVVAAAAAIAFATLLPHDVFLTAVRRTFPDEEILYYREFPSATVFVTRSEHDERWVHFSDQRASGGTMNLPGHRFWGHLPSLLAERRRSALVITFGSGITLGAVATHPFREIVCAEICEGIREPAKLFPENHDVLGDPRVRLVIDDGRNYVLGTDRRFDVVVSEPPLLETAGVVNLYTEEFYDLVKRRLAPGGVFCQWIPSFEFDRPEHAAIVRTFLKVFPDATFWGSPLYGDTMLLGGNGPIAIDLDRIAKRLEESRVRNDLSECGIRNADEVLGYFGLSSRGLSRYCGDGPVLTDDRTRLDFEMPRARLRPTPFVAATFWKRRFVVPPHVLEMEDGESVIPWVRTRGDVEPSWRDRLARLEAAKRAVIGGHVAAVEGRLADMSREYEQALRLDPDYTNARYYAALDRIERAERAAGDGDLREAARLAASAAPLAREFAHLERRIDEIVVDR